MKATKARIGSTQKVAVIGGGPAGSVAATRLAQQGIEVALFEREKFPRFHIGESLLPHGNRVLKAIGVWEEIVAAGFIEKRGAQFTLPDRSRTVRNVFAQGWVPGLDFTYQVERARFDEILLQHARASGVSVYEEAQVRAARQLPGGWELSIARAGQVEVVGVDWVVDASGRNCVMGRTLKLPKSALPYPGRMAVFNHFENMVRDEGDAAGDVIVMRMRDAWFWAIPISASVTSVGVVLQKGDGRKDGESWQDLFWRKVNESSFFISALAHARAIGEYRIDSDYSFSYQTFGARRALLAGDAASFIDPVFSSGVYLALESGLLAADTIAQQCLQNGVGSPVKSAVYKSYTAALKRQMHYMRQLVDTYYDEHGFEVLMTPHPGLHLPQAVNAVLAGCLNPDWAVRWRLWLFRQLCKLHKKRGLVTRIDWNSTK